MVKRAGPSSVKCSIADDDRVIADWPLQPAQRGSKIKGPAGAAEAGISAELLREEHQIIGSHEMEYQWQS